MKTLFLACLDSCRLSHLTSAGRCEPGAGALSTEAERASRSVAEGATLASQVRSSGLGCQAAMAQETAEEEYPASEAGGGREEATRPRARGGDPEETHYGSRGQGQQQGGSIPEAVAVQAQEGLGAIPRWRSSGTAVVRRYLSSKVGNSSCALLEQPVKRYPMPRVRNPNKMVDVARAHQRADKVKLLTKN